MGKGYCVTSLGPHRNQFWLGGSPKYFGGHFWVGLVGGEVVGGDIGITLPDFPDGQESSMVIL